jgi:hypothetical protein
MRGYEEEKKIEKDCNFSLNHFDESFSFLG